MNPNDVIAQLKNSPVILKRARESGCTHLRYRTSGKWTIIEGMRVKEEKSPEECLYIDIQSESIAPINATDSQFLPAIMVLGHVIDSEGQST